MNIGLKLSVTEKGRHNRMLKVLSIVLFIAMIFVRFLMENGLEIAISIYGILGIISLNFLNFGFLGVMRNIEKRKDEDMSISFGLTHICSLICALLIILLTLILLFSGGEPVRFLLVSYACYFALLITGIIWFVRVFMACWNYIRHDKFSYTFKICTQTQ